MSTPDDKRLKILMITSRLPYPLDKGDKLRAFYQLQNLSQMHEVHVMSIVDTDPNINDVLYLRSKVFSCHIMRITSWQRVKSLFNALWSKTPLQVAWFYSKSIKRYVERQSAEINADIIICQLARTAHYLPSGNAFKTLDYMDAFGIGMVKRASISSGILKWLYALESKRTLNYEIQIASKFDKLVIISEQDKSQMRITSTKEIDVVPNGIDEAFFEELNTEKKFDVVFVGNLNYLPNIEAAEYLVNEIFPYLPKSTTCLLAGKSPHQRVLNLASSQIIIAANVVDIREAYGQGRVMCAPLWSGTGQQNKILEAMAIGVPCVTTSSVNSAIGAQEGVEILIAENANDFASSIQKLLGDKMLNESMSSEAKWYVRQTFQWKAMAAKLIQRD